jgi:hypothetical protein
MASGVAPQASSGPSRSLQDFMAQLGALGAQLGWLVNHGFGPSPGPTQSLFGWSCTLCAGDTANYASCSDESSNESSVLAREAEALLALPLPCTGEQRGQWHRTQAHWEAWRLQMQNYENLLTPSKLILPSQDHGIRARPRCTICYRLRLRTSAGEDDCLLISWMCSVMAHWASSTYPQLARTSNVDAGSIR